MADVQRHQGLRRSSATCWAGAGTSARCWASGACARGPRARGLCG